MSDERRQEIEAFVSSDAGRSLAMTYGLVIMYLQPTVEITLGGVPLRLEWHQLKRLDAIGVVNTMDATSIGVPFLRAFLGDRHELVNLVRAGVGEARAEAEAEAAVAAASARELVDLRYAFTGKGRAVSEIVERHYPLMLEVQTGPPLLPAPPSPGGGQEQGP